MPTRSSLLAPLMTTAMLALLPLATAPGQTTTPSANAQTPVPADSARVRVTVTAAETPLAQVVVHAGRVGTFTDERGVAILVLAPGQQTVVASKLGFRSDSAVLTLRSGADTSITFALSAGESEGAAQVAPVIVTAARTEQRVEAVPLRVEVLAGEDIGEKNAVRPGDLTQMVAEIPGVRVQSTAPGLGGAALRVQGFRGEYTEFLTDGLPLGGTADAGFSLVQQPPLDLQQVEVIKGAASALYGPSALGGVVNFVTRRPPKSGAEPIRDAVIAGSSHGALDGVTFLGAGLTPTLGYTVLAGAHYDPVVDRDHDGWADVPASSRAELRPRLYWANAHGSTLLGTIGFSGDDRRGGTVAGATTPAGAPFVEQLSFRHADAGVSGRFAVAPSTVLNIRSSFSALRRRRDLGGAPERDHSHTGLLETSLTAVRGSLIWVAGAAVQNDAYTNLDVSGFDYDFVTTSAFAQLTAVIGDRLSASATARCDHHNVYGTSCAPLAAILVRQPSGWSERLSGGLGSFAPTPLTDETQTTGLARTRPFFGPSADGHVAERARYAAFDLGYHHGPLDANATAYASDILHPLTVAELAAGPYAQALLSAPRPTRTRGIDVFAVYNADPVAVTAFWSVLQAREYSFDRVSAGAAALQPVPLDPSHRVGLDVALDLDEIGSRVAVEAYYTGTQYVQHDPYRSSTRPYTTVELLATQRVGRVQLFVSAENLTNVMQTDYDPLLLPVRSRTGRWTTDVWAPLESRVVRAGIRASLGAGQVIGMVVPRDRP